MISEWYFGCLAHWSDSEATKYHPNAQFSKEQFWVSSIIACVKLLHETVGAEDKNCECHQGAIIVTPQVDIVRAPWPGLLHKACWFLSTSLTKSSAAASNKNSNRANDRN